MEGFLGNPAFLFAFAVIQAALLLVLVRFLDVHDRQPLALVGFVAAWGATGAASLSLAGNEAVRGMLSGDVRVVFGDAIAAPLVEETAKGLALLAAVGPVRRLAARAGVTLFEGVGAGVVYGAAVGVGFAFTEDISFLLDRARAEGLDAGLDTFLVRRDFFGPAILHHAVFTAAFGAALGLATWSTRRALKLALPLAGFVLAVLLHAANNGLVELVLVLSHGIEATAAWVQGAALDPALATTADRVTRLMRVVDFAYLVVFFGAAVLWTRYQRGIVVTELAEEVDGGLVEADELHRLADARARAAADWSLVRTGQLERWRHRRRIRRELARLALLKWRTRRFGGAWSRVQQARRELAALMSYEIAQVELPVPPGPLIGRDREVRELRALLGRPEVRLITLTGPGGTGKTRLAIAVATQVRDRFAGGVIFVDLAALTEADLVPAVVAGTLGVQEVPGEPVLERLKEALRDRHMLLVLDNFEQVVAAAPALAELLAAAPRLRLLVTSRASLRIAGEHERPVLPLGLPDPAARTAPAQLAKHPAVALFVERARGVRPGFALTEDNAAAVAEVCVRLDGLPLAIELAAARCNVLTPQAVLERLGDRLNLLSGAGGDVSGQHRGLRGTIDWSHDLLDPSEQALFARLGVFVDGAPLEAIEAVAAGPGLSGSALLDALGSLVDKSLVRRIDGAGGASRFTMLETIREYALERLRARSEHDEIRHRHAQWFTALAEEAGAHLAGAEQAVWATRLDEESRNLRSVLAWSRSSGQLEPGLRIAGALPRYWSMRASIEGPRWLGQVLDEADGVAPDVRARALFADGYAALDRGDLARATHRFRASLEVARELGDARATASCLAQLGFLRLAQGESVEAEALCEESVELARRQGDRHVESVALGHLAACAETADDLNRARTLLERSLELRRDVGDRRNVANAMLQLGRVETRRGDLARAQGLLEDGLAMAREVGDAWSTSLGLAGQGRLALALDDRRVAAARLRQALDLTLQRGDVKLVVECLDGLAEVATTAQPAHAALLWGAADRVREELGVSLSASERTLRAAPESTARRLIGDEAFRERWRAGYALSREEAVEAALCGPREPAAMGPATVTTRAAA